jgi:hypothetical protein
LPFDRDTDDELSLAASDVMRGSQQQLVRPMVGPISLILLLVCPDTIRFELLQLEFETPQYMIVADVLYQLENPRAFSSDFHCLCFLLLARHFVFDCLENSDSIIGISR